MYTIQIEPILHLSADSYLEKYPDVSMPDILDNYISGDFHINFSDSEKMKACFSGYEPILPILQQLNNIVSDILNRKKGRLFTIDNNDEMVFLPYGEYILITVKYNLSEDGLRRLKEDFNVTDVKNVKVLPMQLIDEIFEATDKFMDSIRKINPELMESPEILRLISNRKDAEKAYQEYFKIHGKDKLL